MISEEDLVVASLARIVGQELHTIDNNTLSTKSGPANKIDPRTFLTRNNNYRNNSNVQQKDGVSIKMHDGQAFFAGVDEALVQSMYPEPVANSPTPQLQPIQKMNSVVVTQQPTITENINSLTLEKTLKSIDKSLKSIDKTQKALLEYLAKSNLNSNISSE